MIPQEPIDDHSFVQSKQKPSDDTRNFFTYSSLHPSVPLRSKDQRQSCQPHGDPTILSCHFCPWWVFLFLRLWSHGGSTNGCCSCSPSARFPRGQDTLRVETVLPRSKAVRWFQALACAWLADGNAVELQAVSASQFWSLWQDLYSVAVKYREYSAWLVLTQVLSPLVSPWSHWSTLLHTK